MFFARAQEKKVILGPSLIIAYQNPKTNWMFDLAEPDGQNRIDDPYNET